MQKKYYQRSVWSQENKWIESDKETFEAEVIRHRSQFIHRFDFMPQKTIYYFDSKISPVYDWKIEITTHFKG